MIIWIKYLDSGYDEIIFYYTMYDNKMISIWK